MESFWEDTLWKQTKEADCKNATFSSWNTITDLTQLLMYIFKKQMEFLISEPRYKRFLIQSIVVLNNGLFCTSDLLDILCDFENK